LSRGEIVAVVAGDAIDFVSRAEDQRRTLVNRTRTQIKKALSSIGGDAASMLYDESNGVCLVNKAEAPGVISFTSIAWIKKNAAAH
jgi:hypothetical protein